MLAVIGCSSQLDGAGDAQRTVPLTPAQLGYQLVVGTLLQYAFHVLGNLLLKVASGFSHGHLGLFQLLLLLVGWLALRHDRGQVPGRSGGDARGQSPDREPVKVQSPGIERPQPETLQEAHENLQQAIAEHVNQVLQKCTDDELIAELRRREWHGTLRITRTIEL